MKYGLGGFVAMSIMVSLAHTCSMSSLSRASTVFTGAFPFTSTRDLSLVITISPTPEIYHFEAGTYAFKFQITDYTQVFAIAVSEDQSRIYVSAQKLGAYGLYLHTYSGTMGPSTPIIPMNSSTVFRFMDTNADGKVVVGSLSNLVVSCEIDSFTMQQYPCPGSPNQVAVADDGLTVFTLCSATPEVQIYYKNSTTATSSIILSTVNLTGAAGNMLKINSNGMYLFLSDGNNSYSYVNSLGAYNLLSIYPGSVNVSFSDDLTYVWRDVSSMGHEAVCNNMFIENVVHDPFQPLYQQVSIASDGLSVLAFGQTPLGIDYFFTCSFANCLSCTPLACLLCQPPFVEVAGTCITCNVPYCQSCSSSNICQNCNPTFTLTTTFTCVCTGGTTLSLTSSQCVSCSLPHCSRCDISNICASCSPTFVLVNGTCTCLSPKKVSSVATCVDCSIVGCSKCSSDNFCFACLATFALAAGSCSCPANTTLSINSTACATCIISFCSRCDVNNICAACASSFTAIAGTCLCTTGTTFNTTTFTCVNYSLTSTSPASNITTNTTNTTNTTSTLPSPSTTTTPSSPSPSSSYQTTAYVLAGVVALFGVTIIGMLFYIKSLPQIQPPPDNIEPFKLRTTEKTEFRIQEMNQIEGSQLQIKHQMLAEEQPKPHHTSKEKPRRKSRKKVQMREIVDEMDMPAHLEMEMQLASQPQ